MKSKTVNLNKCNDLLYITFPKLTATNAVNHAFSTKLGGVSEGYFSSMNMSFSKGEEREKTEENYRRLCSAIGSDISHLVFSHQTHTDNIKTVTKEHLGVGFNKPPFNDIDGLITNESGVALVTQYADCTPLLFCDPVKKVIAASHSGWRGTVKQIGRKTVERMVGEFGCNPDDIIAAIGPSICKDCYEVDDPVLEAFKKTDIDLKGVFTSTTVGHYQLDLRLANKKILMSAGIREENIDIADICTCCNSEYLYSHRVMGEKRGNLAAIIELK
ncbi:MAG: peptidoglycan editing factor PgeF [Clostridia bacterium]|nr:peptidoglycan editing factor PgeF [Clostridia bacterium]